MNIGIVCYPTFGGSGAIATELGKALANKGHKVHFISYNLPFKLNHFNENIIYHEVEWYEYPLFEYQPYESALTSKIVDVALYESLDVLHVHYAIPHASAAYMAKQILLSKKIKLPYITTLHGTDITLVGKDPSFEPVIRFSLNNSDAITAVSKALKKETLNTFKIDNNVEVIYNFIDFEKMQHIRKNAKCCISDKSKDEKILMHISNFRKVKRIDDIVKIFSIVRKKVKSKLVLVGDGPEKPYIERIVRNFNLQKDVVFTGRIAEPSEILASADLFLLPSETESFGLSALEAMAMGIPVISSNTGGITEVNINGKTGYTCRVGDIQTMSKRSIELLTHPKKHLEFSQNAIEQAKKFDVKHILIKYMNLYEKVTSENR
ncbi:MAG: N-acetyl-alpha-D-glucosaminyl L-malate synthase BshA [Bacteroidetes bacterium]|nr:MAG: N-acetyl-alpha-D-glucosaminyl L-malate synthase BshA [Bacteroidota bacterium]